MGDLFVEAIDFTADEFPHFLAFLPVVHAVFLVLAPDLLDEAVLECLELLVDEVVQLLLAF